jgi:hypothetical protein
VGFDRVYHLIDAAGENQFPRGVPEANDLAL